MQVQRGSFTISTDPARIDLEVVFAFLTASYWSPGIPRDTLKRAIQYSIPFGVYDGSGQVGFARVVTDRATFAYLADVFILPEYRGRGLSTWLMEVILAHPDLQGLRRFCLLTRDAQGLYARYGFRPLADPSRYMERWDPGIYERTDLGAR
jgi:N-acetylglutamate synthase-like GNAT family acetyltransferase